ncbi:MAG: aspartyl/glutamyl-tRNA amidotransferase subunit B [Deltaproteobacteria bacterium RIFCSPLOWO2_01_44_7]|nr:MAG: aspartyl/glutamyl-tRNA amidotransferase subunit B [Deltaproteobacteria bacterium RIFCSPHIGHO2_01_FULL_43_49]OGQ14632.1 MAG: aspartyl/glutamyl-tRNA amidotransferase subunit B [Deltaproteobacteria bacterium RIFCSPHIGHO2_02_FULL_44_53]OGQ28018.1 MAG: aspartyl/glutamyl-tRNA amidotransferase subunit B [Deltaproteobacteria bacterium RIFCSPHIGHO2_12_FULL_44_21]OGQ31230.1 MAG: aspartyl/glutamyl-tRNA amidotransferase subunit B [Deltaproteobacteria bacterium RIFCSPLOWO2_01_FULL_45_74]OGQ42697.1 M
MKYEAVIGLEVHAQLLTKSKLFCACSTKFGAQPNTNICPVCTGQAGALPVLNKTAVEMAIKAGLALNCTIREKSIFARKNYFYPDLPKGYQISQYEFPICLNGYLDIQLNGEPKKIHIQRIHMEEDAGKLLHDTGSPDVSHVDLNRCSTPLIEIVSGPDLSSPEEAGDYLRKLRNILVYLEVCDGNMQEGSLRCDANVSIRPKGSKEFGTRAEIKNVNSFKFLESAITYEIERQAKVLDGGGKIVQETRLWNQAKGETFSMRSKEEAHDYRYFPDPDLLPLVVDQVWIEKIKGTLPELGETKAKRFVSQFGIPEYDAKVLTAEKPLAQYFEECVKNYNAPKKLSNWIMAELLRELKLRNQDITEIKLKPKQLARMVQLIDEGTISGAIAKTIFMEMLNTGEAADKIIEAKGLKQVSDTGAIEACVDKILAKEIENVQRYKSGKTNVFGFFVGAVMKEMQGKANPKIVNEILKKKLEIVR